MIRICAQCVHFSLKYDPGHGCRTCGYDPSTNMVCDKGHYGWDTEIEDGKDYYRTMRKAMDCADFEEITIEELEARS